MAYVLPTPAVAPKNTFSLPRFAFASSRCTRASRASGSGRTALMRLLYRIEGKIQFENVDSRLAEHAESAPFGMQAYQLVDCLLRQPARPGYARYLKASSFRADVRIESACGRRDEVHRNRSLVEL